MGPMGEEKVQGRASVMGGVREAGFTMGVKPGDVQGARFLLKQKATGRVGVSREEEDKDRGSPALG